MTSEVALMNRLAVALAADSATTVTYWEKGARQQRYFKGANKIFNLSSAHPVGFMIYGSGHLQDVPWDVAVKIYRESRGGKPLDAISDYAKDFFRFLGSKEIFSATYQDRHAIRGVCETAGNIAGGILVGRDEVRDQLDDKRKKVLATQAFAEVEKEVAGAPFLTDSCKKLVDDLRKLYLGKIRAEFAAGGSFKFIEQYLDIDQLIDVSVAAYLKARWTNLEKTGLVFAGYGSKEIFPCLEQYECWGAVAGTVLQKRLDDECKSINFDVGSEIVAVAQDDMVNTFVFGASLTALVAMGRNCTQSLDDLVTSLIDAGQLAAGFDTTALKRQASEGFTTRVKEYIWEQHAIPLRRVIGMLPVDELAALAETFVSIESLKERVTRHTESVSGPIDVAVITKGDGFIWIKRKHYFDPSLNIRFVAKKYDDARE